MTSLKIVNLQKSTLKISHDTPTSSQYTYKHVNLNVLSQQVLVAHQARVNVPHSHSGIIQLPKEEALEVRVHVELCHR